MAGSEQWQTPLFSRLHEHAARKPFQFHIPGHKQGAGAPPDLYTYLGERVFAIDLVNIEPLDDLHSPRGAIREAQALAAAAFGADRTFFSVQGTSTAIMAMILSVCKPGDEILLPRNIHKSVVAALVMSGAVPVFLAPEIDETFCVAHGLTAAQVEAGLRKHPGAKAVLAINPTYFGAAPELPAIVELAHARGIPVLSDEAHGAHFHFHAALPPSAMAAGADLAATSMHKLGGSLAQSSVLNLQGTMVDPQRVQAAMSMLTSTSTSYVLLASLDTARMQLATRGEELLGRTLEVAGLARQQLSAVAGLRLLGGEVPPGHMDPTKLCMNTRGLGLRGVQVERWLRERYRIEVEMSDRNNVLFVLSFGHGEADVAVLAEALRHLAREFRDSPPLPEMVFDCPPLPTLVLSPREAHYAATESVPLRQAAGRVIAESVLTYPPGIPLLLPGEVIGEDQLCYLRQCLEDGLPVQGPADVGLGSLRVVR